MSRQPRRSIRRRLPGWIATTILIIGAIGMIAPFLWMFSTSMAPATEAFALPPRWIPLPLRSDNYLALLDPSQPTGQIPLFQTMFNSAVIAIGVTIGTLITCPLAGYAFARLRFPGREGLFLLLLTSLMVPIQVTIIPLFIIMKNLGLVNTPWSLILPGLSSAFGVFLMRQFFLTLPQELLDAASIDGASTFGTFRRIALPLAKPALSALAIITFLGAWNAYFAPLIMLSDISNMTMPLALVAMLGVMKSGNIAQLMAATTVAIVPVAILFVVAQRWIVASFARSGVKG